MQDEGGSVRAQRLVAGTDVLNEAKYPAESLLGRRAIILKQRKRHFIVAQERQG
jgi:hypothetical protein